LLGHGVQRFGPSTEGTTRLPQSHSPENLYFLNANSYIFDALLVRELKTERPCGELVREGAVPSRGGSPGYHPWKICEFLDAKSCIFDELLVKIELFMGAMYNER